MEQQTPDNKPSALPPEPVQPATNDAPSPYKPLQGFDTAPPPAQPPTPPAGSRLSKRLIIIAITALLVGLAVVGGGIWWYTQAQPKKPAQLKVGLMMAFSGGSSNMGYGASKGIQLAKKQLNADNIEIVQADSKCDPKTTEEVIKNLIAQNVVAIIGEGCSSASVAALPTANSAKVPLISPSASSPTLSIPDDYFFRVVPPDEFQGAFMAQAIYDRGIRNVAVFYTNEPYGSGMNGVFREKFESLGGKVVATASAEPDIIDIKTQVDELKAAKPDALFIAPNSVVTATAVMRVAREKGMAVPFFGADIMYDSTIINNAPDIAEGLVISSFSTGTKAFRQALVNEFQSSEQLYAAPQAYDIVKLLQLAAEKGAKTGEQVKAVLPNIGFDGVSGFRHFDQNGEISDKSYQYDLFEVKDGAFSLVEQGN